MIVFPLVGSVKEERNSKSLYSAIPGKVLSLKLLIQKYLETIFLMDNSNEVNTLVVNKMYYFLSQQR